MSDKKPTDYELQQKAERTLICQTYNLSPKDLDIFLLYHSVPRDEYDLIAAKYARLITKLKEEDAKDATNE